MTSMDVQNVPDVWGLLEQARDRMLRWAAPIRKAAMLRKELCDCIDDALLERDRFVLVPKEPTEQMLEALERAYAPAEGTSMQAYAAAISAAPTPNRKP